MVARKYLAKVAPASYTMPMQTRLKAAIILMLVLAAALGSFGAHKFIRRPQAGTAEAATLAVANGLATRPTDRKPEVYEGGYAYRTTDAMLAALHVTVYPEDRVVAFPNPALGLGSVIDVYRAQPVLISDGGDDRLVRTWATTVSALADEQRLDIGAQDVVKPALDSAVPTDGSAFAVAITRVAETDVTEAEAIAFTTQSQDDSTLLLGVQQVKQQGQPGMKQLVYHVRRENGREVSRVLKSSSVTKQPVPKIVLNGTKIVTYGTGKASWYGGVPPMTAAHLTLPKGTKVRVVNLDNGKSVVVTIADRGPYVAGRIIDLSKDAFAQIAPLGAGVANVEIQEYSD